MSSSDSVKSLSKQEPSSDVKKELPPLTRRQYVLIVMLAFAQFSSTVVFSCIAPFFPNEAKAKGVSPTVVGFIFSIFELVMFFAAPFYGKNMDRIGPKNCYCGGLFMTSVTVIMFGFSTMLPDGTIFIVASFAIRILESLGDSAYSTASFSITAKEFPDRVGTIIGFLETFAGLGFTAGPAIGGFLYEAGGFKLPFIVLGVLVFAAAVTACFLIPTPTKDVEKKVGQTGGILALLRIPSVILMCSAITVAAINLTFLDPTLEQHLDSFNVSPLIVGLMFLLVGGVYTVTAPIWGYITDRTPYIREIMIFGAFVSAVALFLIGPSPMLNIEKSLPLIGVSQAILGFGLGALFIPTFKDTLNSAMAAGFPDSYETYGTVSGVFTAFFNFGGFLGPTLGGAGAQMLGFGWTATILSALCVISGIAISLFQINGRCCPSKPRQESDEFSPLLYASDCSDSFASKNRLQNYGANGHF